MRHGISCLAASLAVLALANGAQGAAFATEADPSRVPLAAPAAVAEVPACGPSSGLPKLDYVRPIRPEALGPVRPEAFAVVGAPGSDVTFEIEYLDVTMANGIGFDDAVSGATRRSTAEAVFEYIAGVLPHIGRADIQFQVSQTDGTGFLGSAQPIADVTLVQCQVVHAVTHITSGVDPDATLPDGIITIDFGYTYNEDLGPPAGGEIDLFTLVLHEASHAIGFASSLSVDNLGNGVLGMNPDIRVIGFDDRIENGAGSPMISCPDGTFIGVGGAGGDLEGPPSLRFSGPAATSAWQGLGNLGLPTLYTPASHASGSSATHWDSNDANVPADAVMIHFIAFATEKRVWSSLDLGAMDDAGYFGPTPVPALGPGGLALLALVLVASARVRLTHRSSRARFAFSSRRSDSTGEGSSGSG